LLGGSIAATPNAGINDDGRLEIFAQGTDGAAWHVWQQCVNCAWGSWASLGGGIVGSPSVIVNGNAGQEIFAISTSGGPFHNWQLTPGGGWSGWNYLPGTLNAAPAIGMNFDGRLEAFGIGMDGNVYHNWQLSAGGGWYGWTLLGTASNTGTTNAADIGYLWTDTQNSSNFQAARNNCSNPPWLSAASAWPCGSRVNISIDGYKDKDLNHFRTAIRNWNNELLANFTGGVPVQLYISAGGPQTISVYRVANNSIPIPGHPDQHGRAQNTKQTPDASNRLLSLDIQIIRGMTYGPTITTIFAHELGHTFGLFDCYGCSPQSGKCWSVMDSGEPVPAGHPWGDYISMNWVEGLPAPTQCDINVIKSHLPDYSACIQAQASPPDVPSCTNGTSVGFLDTGQSSSYTCSGSPCTGCNSACNNFASAPCPDSGSGGGGGTTCSQWCGSVCMDTASCSCPGESPTCVQNSGGWFPNCNNSCTPIVLDAFDDGFHFTNIDHGVKFRVTANGPLLQMSWPDQEFRNGWLALDRNGNGKIDDFTELFGNMTPQPVAGDPNGYLALALFDDEMNGGNGNGVIDPDDSVYDHLLLWIDTNHNGISEPEELHSLREVGIFRIDLKYHLSNYVDENGNRFRYKSRVWDDSGKAHDVCYDVFVSVEAVGASGSR
jgi:hypothetical protein